MKLGAAGALMTGLSGCAIGAFGGPITCGAGATIGFVVGGAIGAIGGWVACTGYSVVNPAAAITQYNLASIKRSLLNIGIR